MVSAVNNRSARKRPRSNSGEECSVLGLEPAFGSAQLIEHHASVRAVVGSRPASGTLFPPVLL